MVPLKTLVSVLMSSNVRSRDWPTMTWPKSSVTGNSENFEGPLVTTTKLVKLLTPKGPLAERVTALVAAVV